MTKPAPCPICDAAPQAAYRPFCSKRCADVDLGRWLKGAYAVPAVEAEPPEEVSPAQPAKQDFSN